MKTVLFTIIICLSLCIFTQAQADCSTLLINNAPVSLTKSHCDVMSYDFDASTTEVTWSSNLGTIDANGLWAYVPTLSDVGQAIVLIVTAVDSCGDSSFADIDLIFTNEAPVFTNGFVGGDLATSIPAIFNMSATDECDDFTFSIGSYINVTASIDSLSGELTIFPPEDTGGYYSLDIIVSDGNAYSIYTVSGWFIHCCYFRAEIGSAGSPNNQVPPGQIVSIPISISTDLGINAIDLLISYNSSILNFQRVIPGNAIQNCGWEYFTYRNGVPENCGASCPSGLIRITAIGETNNGPNHPNCYELFGTICTIDFLVTTDMSYECEEVPLNFFWIDCKDNTLVSQDGTEMHVSQKIFTGDPAQYPPFGQDIQDGTVGYPTYHGFQDECFEEPNQKTLVQDFLLTNGSVLLQCGTEQYRGDINLNGIPYEAADVILFSNFFVYGVSVFTINIDGQIAETDINADGLVLALPDLVYLIRIITGDKQPIAKLSPEIYTTKIENNILSIDKPVGAGLVLLQGDAQFQMLAENMEMKSAYDAVNDVTRILIYSLEGNSFVGEFLATKNKLVSIELATPDGASAEAKIIADTYALSQNYPNPFNPNTTIKFTLPILDDIILSIFNVNGQKISEFSGRYETGTHSIEWDASDFSSGVYFYKLETSEFSETKKMILLK